MANTKDRKDTKNRHKVRGAGPRKSSSAQSHTWYILEQAQETGVGMCPTLEVCATLGGPDTRLMGRFWMSMVDSSVSYATGLTKYTNWME